MKNILYAVLAMSMLAISCGKKENNNKSAEDGQDVSTASEGVATGHGSTGAGDSPTTDVNAGVAIASFSTKGIIKAYLQLQDALAGDDAKGAASAGKALVNEFDTVDLQTVAANKRADYLDIVADAKEHAEHISLNASDIAHQREHMAILSRDMSDLVTAFGSDTKLYQAHCPMYNDGKGAVWLSAGRDIRNPYYGKEMLTCGSIKKEF